MDNCPEEYYKNCRMRSLRCNICAAGTGTKRRIYYQPINPKLQPHPADPSCRPKPKKVKDQVHSKRVKDQVHSKRVKAGLKRERKLAEQLGGKLTMASGATLGDGDLYFEIKGIRISLDSKLRHNRKGVGVSSEEWSEMEASKLNGFIITNILPTGEERQAVLLTLDTFKLLLESQIEDA